VRLPAALFDETGRPLRPPPPKLQPAPIGAFVDAPLRADGTAGDAPQPADDPVSLLPLWRRHYGALPGTGGGAADVLFITNDLNIGGAQRSLTNLLAALDGTPQAWLCVLSPVLVDDFIAELAGASVPAVSCAGLNQQERIAAVLTLAEQLRPRTICFWNVEAGFKLLLAAVLRHAGIRLVEVSPGPFLFGRFAATVDLQQRIGFSIEDFFRRLDVFVSKYQDGVPAVLQGLPRAVAVIPNGVPEVPDLPRLDPAMRPAAFDPEFAIVTTCRFMPEKRLEWLVPMMQTLTAREKRASLTIVGGIDDRMQAYFRSVLEEVERSGLDNIHFAGPNPRSASFLGLFKVFIMISDGQGCPNASLEAMACGLPVVANNNGGTREQIIEGVTGHLVSTEAPEEMAARVAALLADPGGARAMGEAGRRLARERFSMPRMVEHYRRIL
jgi:glycosyltransferase involved in cell wall biosynthesis